MWPSSVLSLLRVTYLSVSTMYCSISFTSYWRAPSSMSCITSGIREPLHIWKQECKDRPTAITATTLHSSGNSQTERYDDKTHYWHIVFYFFGLFNCSCTDVAPWLDSSSAGWGSCSWRWWTLAQLSGDCGPFVLPQVTEDQAAYVATLISDHHQDFCELYPDHSVIPKMHFMVHMPWLMIQ